MPVTEVTVTVVATVWVCDFCGRAAQHTAGTGAPLSAEHFIDTLRWLALGETTVACERCRVLPEVAHWLFLTARAALL